MIDKKRIAEEAEHFFEWPDPKNKTYVTLASCSIFAATIAEMVRKEERARAEKWHARALELRSVLRVIVEQDPIELALDPQWSQRIANGGLEATQEA